MNMKKTIHSLWIGIVIVALWQAVHADIGSYELIFKTKPFIMPATPKAKSDKLVPVLPIDEKTGDYILTALADTPDGDVFVGLVDKVNHKSYWLSMNEMEDQVKFLQSDLVGARALIQVEGLPVWVCMDQVDIGQDVRTALAADAGPVDPALTRHVARIQSEVPETPMDSLFGKIDAKELAQIKELRAWAAVAELEELQARKKTGFDNTFAYGGYAVRYNEGEYTLKTPTETLQFTPTTENATVRAPSGRSAALLAGNDQYTVGLTENGQILLMDNVSGTENVMSLNEASNRHAADSGMTVIDQVLGKPSIAYDIVDRRLARRLRGIYY